MTAQVLVTLPDSVYERVQRFAEAHQQGIAEAIAEYLDSTLPREEAIVSSAKQGRHSIALRREKAAYIAMHAILKEQYLGRYVAFYGGNLIDTDKDYGALYERVRSRYPDEVVLVTQVQEEPVKTIHVRSPRLGR